MNELMTVLRLENHKSGCGPYNPGVAFAFFAPGNKVETLTRLMTSLTLNSVVDHPTPEEDGISMMDVYDYCGFESEGQMFDWFPEEFLKVFLDKLGDHFGVYAYVVRERDIQFGVRQLIFRKEEAIERLRIV